MAAVAPADWLDLAAVFDRIGERPDEEVGQSSSASSAYFRRCLLDFAKTALLAQKSHHRGSILAQALLSRAQAPVFSSCLYEILVSKIRGNVELISDHL